MTEVSGRAWNELVAAEVAYRLRQVDVPMLHIKGPTVATWLYDEGERSWSDVDILVPPGRLEHALAALQSAGYTERHPGVNRRTTRDHAITVVHHLPGEPHADGVEVDVHDRFEGIDDDPHDAFEVLWSRRRPARLGHTDVWFPDLPTRALLVALNTARDVTSKTRADLARLVTACDQDTWREVLQLAQQVGALPALRAGLEIDPAGVEVVTRLGLHTVPISPEWQLRTARAPRTAIRMAELRRIDPRHRPGAVLRWLFPAPAIIRMRDPAARGGLLKLAAGYLRRLRDGLRALPPSVRALRHLARVPGAPGGGRRRVGGEPTGQVQQSAAAIDRPPPDTVEPGSDAPASTLDEAEHVVPEHVAWTQQDGGIVLLADLRSGSRHLLSPSGSLVWAAVAQGASRTELDAQLLDAFADPGPDYVAEVDQLLASLEHDGLLARRSA